MNLNTIINDIENNEDVTERCISYAEAIIYLKTLKASYYFEQSKLDWKNKVNDELIKDVYKVIDKSINDLKDMIKINVDLNKIK